MLNIANDSKINFKSTPVNIVHLKNAKNSPVKAVFSELEKDDTKIVTNLVPLWGEKARYIDPISYSFLGNKVDDPHRFFSLDLLEGNLKNLSEKIVGIAKLKFLPDSKLKIAAIQARPDCIYSDKSTRNFKGIGENFLSEIFALSKKFNIKNVGLISTNDDFYNNTFFKAGINYHEFDGFFQIPDKSFDKYINYVKNKYEK